MADAGAVLVVVGFKAAGNSRGKRYQKADPQLAEMVGKCYTVTPAGAHSVSDPLADYLVEVLPEPIQEATDAVLGPAAIISGMYALLSECARNEQRIVEEYYSRRVRANMRPQAPPPSPVEPDFEAAATPPEEVMVDAGPGPGATGD